MPSGILVVFVLCLVYPIMPVSLDCPFLIAPSVVSDVYLGNKGNNKITELRLKIED